MRRALLGLLAAAAAGCSTSVDWQTPHAYPCSRTSTDPQQCPGGWVCGLEGSCHDPDLAFPFQCEGDSDCAPSWRCGLSGVCHDRDAGAPYPCAADLDCERGWRCAVDGRCVDAVADAVTPDAGYGTLAVTAVSPTAGPGYPDLLSGTRVTVTDGYGTVAKAVGFTLARGTQLTQLAYFPDLFFTGNGFDLVIAQPWTQTLPQPPLAVATVGLRGYYLDAQGLGSLDWTADAGVPARWGTASGATSLRASPDPTQVLLAASDTAVQLFDPRTGTFRGTPIRLAARDGGTQRLWDVAAGESTGLAAADPRRLWLAAAGDDGLYVAYRTDAGALIQADGGAATAANAWSPLEYPRFPNRGCNDNDAGFRPLRLYRSTQPQDDYFGVEAIPWGADPTTAGRLIAVLNGTASYDPFPACGTVNGVSTWGPCQPCLPGETMSSVEFFSSGLGTLSGASVTCAAADGRTQRPAFFLGDCTPRPEAGLPFYSEPLRATRGRMDQSVVAGASGELWVVDDQITSLTLDHPPALLYSPGDTGLAAVDPLQGLWLEQPGIGLVQITYPGSLDEPSTYAAAADGQLRWVVTVDASGAPVTLQENGAGTGYALQFPRLSDSHAPFTATSAFRPDGGLELVVGVFDKLLAAPFRADGGVLEVSALEVKSVPSPFIPITSVATAVPAPPPDGGAPAELLTYVLTQNGVYAVTAFGEHLWQTSQVAVPAGTYLRVWFDGARGRLGDAAGTVYALPSRTRIAPALPGGAQAIDYASLCGRTLALSPSGLFELRPAPSGGVGTWSALDLAAFLGPADPALGSGRLARDGRSVVLVTGRGVVLRFDPPAGCASP